MRSCGSAVGGGLWDGRVGHMAGTAGTGREPVGAGWSRPAVGGGATSFARRGGTGNVPTWLVVVVGVPAPLAAALVALFLGPRGGLLLGLRLALGAGGAAPTLVALGHGAGRGAIEAGAAAEAG